MRKTLGKRGFSLLEVVLSMSIVTISFWGAIACLQFLWKGVAARKIYSNEIEKVRIVFNNIRSNPAHFYTMSSRPDETVNGQPVTPAEFPTPNSATGEFSDAQLALFQYAYQTTGAYFGSPAGCPNCNGRMMYILQDYGSHLAGGKKATVRMVVLKEGADGRMRLLHKTKDFFSYISVN